MRRLRGRAAAPCESVCADLTGVHGRRSRVQDDYVYYPGYQVYCSSNHRQYIYLENRAWVTRPAGIIREDSQVAKKLN